MNTDEIKAAWLAIDKRFERENQLNWRRLRDQHLGVVQSNLRPLVWGQCIQIILGICMIVFASGLWSVRPDGVVTVAAGVLVHAYGVVCIISAGIVLGGIRGLNYAAPVLNIQTQLANVRKRYVISGMIAGLPWWLMWLAVIIVLHGLSGSDLYAHSPVTVWSGMSVGVIGLLMTALFHIWSRSGKRPTLAKYMDNAVTGASLRKAQDRLEELRHFELEE